MTEDEKDEALTRLLLRTEPETLNVSTSSTQQALQTNLKSTRARGYATMIIHELSKAGYIADHCRSEATFHLTDLFCKENVVMTTAAQRKRMAAD